MTGLPNVGQLNVEDSPYRKLSVSKEGKALVYSGQTVVPGELLGICGTSVKSRTGTWQENRMIRSSVLGTVTVNPHHDENTHRIEISVSRPSGSLLINTLFPAVGDIVIAEVTAVDVLEVQCVVRTVGGQPLENPLPAVMRMENIEPLNPHLVELEDHFAVKDLIVARVITVASPIQLDVAGDPKLGVVMSWSAAGCVMIPTGSREVCCPETFRKVAKRLSTAVIPIPIQRNK